MKTPRLITLSIVLVLLPAVCAVAQEAGKVEKIPPSTSAPKGKTLESVSKEGQPYWYRLPKKLSAKNPPNLIFMLHGTGMPWGWAFWNYSIDSGAFRKNDILVAPEGVTPGHGGTFNFVQGKKDGDQIAGLIRLFRQKYPVNKVYVYGHSQGAFFAYWFAGAYTELVDGIVAHAGNVLDVDHNKLAKSKVAIGILHGKADAVVPVECALRTEKIYRDAGYEKIKLYVVEGLNAKTGHWPLPRQVSEMFEWLDQVSSDSPGQCLDTAWSELAEEAPDLAQIVDAAGKAGTFLKKYRGEDREQLAARLGRIEELLAQIETAQAEALVEQIQNSKSKEFKPWMTQFRVVHQAFQDSRTWKKRLKTQIALAKKHDKTVTKAMNRIMANVDKKSLLAALGALEKCPLAADYDRLATLMSRRVEKPPKGFKNQDVERFRNLIESRTEGIDEGEARAREVAGELISPFLEGDDAEVE